MIQLPPVTKALLLANVGMFIITNMMPGLEALLTGYYFQSENFGPWQLITYMFLHANISHLFFNMFGVYMFGAAVEKYWGGKKFLIFYVVAGLGAFALHQLITMYEVNQLVSQLSASDAQEVWSNGYNILSQGKNYINLEMGKLNLALNVGMVGASGCLFGLLMAYGFMFPNAEMMLLFFPVPIKAKYFVLGYGAIELILGVSNRSGDNVAHFAHLGGMIAGYIMLKQMQSQGRLFSS